MQPITNKFPINEGPKNEHVNLAVIIPTYNRSSVIRKNLTHYLNTICSSSKKFNKSVRVIVVDDCSDDKTWDILCELADAEKN